MKLIPILFIIFATSCTPIGFFAQTAKKFTQGKIKTFAPNAVFGDSTDIQATMSKKQIDKILGRRLQRLFAERGDIGLSWRRTGANRDSVKIHIYYHNKK